MKEMKEYEAEVRRRIGEKTDKIKRTRRTLGVILPLVLCIVIVTAAAMPAMTGRRSNNAARDITKNGIADKNAETETVTPDVTASVNLFDPDGTLHTAVTDSARVREVCEAIESVTFEEDPVRGGTKNGGDVKKDPPLEYRIVVSGADGAETSYIFDGIVLKDEATGMVYILDPEQSAAIASALGLD